MKMHRSIRIALPIAAMFLLGLGRPTCVQPKSHLLDIPPVIQETEQWCWAASGAMTMNYIRKNPALTQCSQANQRFRFRDIDCCTKPTHPWCVQTGWPDYEANGFSKQKTVNASLEWGEIKRQIYCRKTPFAFSWHMAGDSGHMMVAIGYKTANQRRYVEVNNPYPGIKNRDIYSYAKYKGGGGFDHTHWDDFYEITYVGEDQ